jgi:ABC-type antimicrobial peptide transport system permease subunit
MLRFSWLYASRNAIYYRAKYSVAFAMIAAFSACLALSLFSFNGFWSQAGAYARSWGDITFYANPSMIDMMATSKAKEKSASPWKSIEAGLPAFFKDELKATKYFSGSFVDGDAYYKTGKLNLTAMNVEKAKALWGVDLSEGAMPREGEALVPVSMRRSIAVGDAVTFVFKNRDTILNSFQFRVSGFFLPAGRYSGFLYLGSAQYEALDPGRPDDVFFVYLANGGSGSSFPTDNEYNKANSAFRRFVWNAAGTTSSQYVGYETAASRYKDSRTIIDFFQLLFGIFLVAIVIVAVATLVNVVIITLIDRIKIVGTFMAYGMRRRRAVLLLASETLVFSLAACTLGVLAALAIAGPLAGIKFLADNWTIAVILGGKRTLTILPDLKAVAATYAAGVGIPFVAAVLAASKMLKGDVVRLLHFVK